MISAMSPVVTTTIYNPQYQTTITIATTTTLSYTSRHQIPAYHQQALDDWQTESDRIENLLKSIKQNLRLSGYKLSRALLEDIGRSKSKAGVNTPNSMARMVFTNQVQGRRTVVPWARKVLDKWQVAWITADRQQRKAQDLEREYRRQILIPPDVDFVGTEFYSEINEITSFDIILSTDIDEAISMHICGTARRVILNERDDNRIRVHCPSDLDTPILKAFYTKGRRSELSLINETISMPTGTNAQLNTPKLKPQIRIIEEYQNPNFCCTRDVVVEVIVGNSDLARRSTATGSYGGQGFSDLEFDDDRFRLVYAGCTIENNVIGNSDFRGIIHINEPGAPTHHLAYNGQMVVQSDSNTGSETS